MPFEYLGFKPVDVKLVQSDVYLDIDKATSTQTLYATVKVMNNEGQTLYVKIGPNPDATNPSRYSFTEQTFGAVNDGEALTCTYDGITATTPDATEIPTPPSLLDETIYLRCYLYTDDSYTNLYEYVDFTVDVHWFNSNDSNWNVLLHSNFDDGTRQEWIAWGNASSLGPVSDTYVSPPYSIAVRNTDKEYYSGMGIRRDGVSIPSANIVLITAFVKWVKLKATAIYDKPVIAYIKDDTQTNLMHPEFNAPDNVNWRKISARIPITNDTISMCIGMMGHAGESFARKIYVDDIKIIYA